MMNSQVQGKLSLKKDDQVQIIAGRERGKIGKILNINVKTARVTVEKANMVKRHTRATQQSAGGIVEKELPLHYSNVLLLCPKCNRGVRHASKMVEKKGKSADGSVRQAKIRVCKRCGESLDIA